MDAGFPICVHPDGCARKAIGHARCEAHGPVPENTASEPWRSIIAGAAKHFGCFIGKTWAPEPPVDPGVRRDADPT